MRALTFHIAPRTWLRTKLIAAVRGQRAYWGRASGLRLAEVPVPELPGDDWVRCRTLLGGICGSDLAMLLLRHPPDSILQAFSSMPLVPGHENVAEVAACGAGADPSWLGRRVCVEPTLGCAARGIDPPCPSCAAGQFNVCENFAPPPGADVLPAGTSTGYNARTGGSWGESFVAHVSQLVPVPETLADEQAILTDPLACSLHAVLRSRWQEARLVCVYGGGVLGLGIVAALRAVGYAGRIELLARHPFQRERAVALGADEAVDTGADVLTAAARRVGGRIVKARFGARMLLGGYDVVYECVGAPGTLSDALKLARAAGQVVLVGTAGPGRIDPTPVWFQEVDLVGAYGRQVERWQGRDVGTYALVHELLAAGALRADGLLTHTFPLDRYPQAFEAAVGRRRSGAIKVAFDLR